MSEKRKDNKGRILKTGESQRKNLSYQYRYTDVCGVRRTIYAPDLTTLREKEKEIQLAIDSGFNYKSGLITVLELLYRYFSPRFELKTSTVYAYKLVSGFLRNTELGNKQISAVKSCDVQKWVSDMYKDGLAYGTIRNALRAVRAAFDMACDDDILLKNPIKFKLTDLINNNSEKREALTNRQQELFLEFIKDHKKLKRYYDLVVVLIETGMRVGEICGLTLNDIDFENKKINIKRQLRHRDCSNQIAPPKSSSSIRSIPMSATCYESLQRMVLNRKRPRQEIMVDGIVGFLMVKSDGGPRTSSSVRYAVKTCYQEFLAANPDIGIPHISTHVLRHTFCTNMINAGISINNVQYMMGHSSASITLDVYTHNNFESASQQMWDAVGNDKTTGVKDKNLTPNLTPLHTPFATQATKKYGCL